MVGWEFEQRFFPHNNASVAIFLKIKPSFDFMTCPHTDTLNPCIQSWCCSHKERSMLGDRELEMSRDERMCGKREQQSLRESTNHIKASV